MYPQRPLSPIQQTVILPSGRCLRNLKSKTSRIRNSFFHTDVSVLNNPFTPTHKPHPPTAILSGQQYHCFASYCEMYNYGTTIYIFALFVHLYNVHSCVISFITVEYFPQIFSTCILQSGSPLHYNLHRILCNS